jgi:hypothetical protein
MADNRGYGLLSTGNTKVIEQYNKSVTFDGAYEENYWDCNQIKCELLLEVKKGKAICVF